jgi:hypothetical protein
LSTLFYVSVDSQDLPLNPLGLGPPSVMAEPTATTNLEKATTSPSDPTLAETNLNEKKVKRKPGETWKKNDIHEIPNK